VLAGLTTLGPSPPMSPGAAAAAAALLVAVLPRIGWLVAALGVCGWLASPEADRAGSALVLACALAPVPVLLPRSGLLWSAPALAPLLGSVALAPLYVGVACLAVSAWRRVALAAAGLVWLVLAEVITGHGLLFGAPPEVRAPEVWEASAFDAARNALYPLAFSPALAPAAVWAAFALVLPLAVRGRWTVLDVVVAAAWAAGLVAAHGALADLLADGNELEQARGAVAGAALGALVAVAVWLVAPPVADGAREPALP